MITANIIGYNLSESSGRSIHSFYPLNGTTGPESFSVASPDDVNLALEKAHQAWRVYRNISGANRAAFLMAIAEGIEKLGDILVERIMLETAYPASRVITERTRTCAQLRLFAKIADENSWQEKITDEALPDRAPVPRPELIRKMMAVGPVVVFGASNFPLAYSTAGGDTASALAVGCPVIVKAHDAHLGTNALVAEVILNAARETNMPDGVFSSLHGDGFATGQLLVQHPRTAAVGFTGSGTGGRALFDLAAQREHPIPVFAEMGSINPVFLLPDKVKEGPETLAKLLAGSMTMSAGQFCTKPGLMVAMDDDYTSGFIKHMTAALESIEPATLLTNGISHSFHKGIEAIREIDGVAIVKSTENQQAYAVMPVLATVSADLFLKHKAFHREIFGPYALLVLCRSLDEMKRVAEHIEGQLTATIHVSGSGLSMAETLVELLTEKAGRIVFNGVPTGVEVCSAMTHGGPYPASTDARFTAVGPYATRRWIRPVTFQNTPAFWPEV